ncbi:ComEA family DNA-binding protein [Lysobacter niastensis]|uniref:Helix-hairpin-helix domain-containing protein n=1 Tax=Lysobacter niastensis TaxID=380629 RepID=A0ABS0B393_9GAMM|nr:helix-hairpin-helix domain-containing protein [Lysobacter niastensis]MBF6022946.1 helix-hairpin-helix domain-containing protein [Lysobacter niastensis]
MKSILATLTLSIAAVLPLAGAAAELGVLAPVIVDGKPQERAAPNGGAMVPVVTRVNEGKLFDQLQHEAREGFTASVLALDEAAQRASGKPMRPTWLFLSLEDGGFPRFGFWLQEGGQARYVADHYVDLVTDEDTVANGGFEEIFAHEQGHVLLRRLLPSLPAGYSRTPHAALAVTDRVTAFDEGFAMHFQALARRFTRNEQLRAEDDGLTGKPFLPYWASHADRTWRLEGTRRNSFVQRQLPLPGEADPILARDHSPLFDPGHLKSGDQMMASEGVISTVCYRWLAPGEGTTQALLQRYGKLFDALKALDKRGLTNDSPVLVELIQSYAMRYPQEGEQAKRVFIETTYGATVDPAMARQSEALAAVGSVGDMEGFVGGLKPARAAMAKLTETTTPATLGRALSAPIWLYSDAPTKPGQSQGGGLAFDVNTVEPEQLQALGLDAATAQRIVEDRRAHGPYADLASLSKRAALTPANVAKLDSLNRAALRAGPTLRR